MNAVDSAEGAVVMGEVTNEDTVPAFVTVNATLVDGAGNPIDDESSFDKIAHILLPKQVTPYRIDFPNLNLKNVKKRSHGRQGNSGPRIRRSVIGVMNQKIDTDPQGKSVLRGDLAESEWTDGEHSARHRQLLRQQRQGRVGIGWLRRSRAAAAIVGALCGRASKKTYRRRCTVFTSSSTNSA